MISKIVLGTVQLGLNYGINNTGGKPSIQTAFKILNTAFDKGIRIIDTAEAYGNSIEVIGKFQKQHPEKKFKIISKLSANAALTNKSLLSHVLDSCEVLNTSQLYGYMFHNYNSLKDNINIYEELLNLKYEGIILNAGISLYTNEEMIDIIENFSDFDFIQIPFNLLDNNLKRESTILKAKKKGIAIHTRSTFLQGLFFMELMELPNKLMSLKPYLEKIKKIASQSNLTIDALALHYVLQKEYIDHVLIGVDTAKQLLDNIKICNNNLDVPNNKIDVIDVVEHQLLNPSNWL